MKLKGFVWSVMVFLAVAGAWVVDASAESREVVIRGPRPLVDLMADAAKEERPDLSVRTEIYDLRNRVWMSGPGGSDYIPLSPKRKNEMQDAMASGRSVYLTLCGEQKATFDRLLGPEPVARQVEPEQPPVVYKRRVPQRQVVYLDQPQCVWVPPMYVGVYPFVPYTGFDLYGYYGGGWYSSRGHGFRDYGSYFHRGWPHRQHPSGYRGHSRHR